MIYVVNDETGEIVREYEDNQVRLFAHESVKKKESPEKKNETGLMAMDNSSFVKVNNIEFGMVIRELKPMEAKLLMNMMNMVEYKSNCIVFGRNRELTDEFLAEWCGVSRKSISDAIRGLTKKWLIARVVVEKDRKRNQYYANPWLVTKGEKVNATLKSMFREYEIRSKGMVKWKDLDKDKEAEKWKRYRK